MFINIKARKERIKNKRKDVIIDFLRKNQTEQLFTYLKTHKIPRSILKSKEIRDAGLQTIISILDIDKDIPGYGSHITKALMLQKKLLLPKELTKTAAKLGMFLCVNKQNNGTALSICRNFKLFDATYHKMFFPQILWLSNKEIEYIAGIENSFTVLDKVKQLIFNSKPS